MITHPRNQQLYKKYACTAWFYDLLDHPWERHYKYMRQHMLAGVSGAVLEAGVGTGRNLPYYSSDVALTGIDLSPAMLRIAKWRARKAKCTITALCQEDATLMPNSLQPLAIEQLQRVLKPGGRFKILDMVYSHNPAQLKRQLRYAKWIEKIYGARFDRPTLAYLQSSTNLEIEQVRFIYKDIYQLIEGRLKK